MSRTYEALAGAPDDVQNGGIGRMLVFMLEERTLPPGTGVVATVVSVDEGNKLTILEVLGAAVVDTKLLFAATELTLPLVADGKRLTMLELLEVIGDEEVKVLNTPEGVTGVKRGTVVVGPVILDGVVEGNRLTILELIPLLAATALDEVGCAVWYGVVAVPELP